MTKTTVLNPVSFPSTSIPIERTYLTDLKLKPIGFLCNNKPNADILLKRLSEQLHGRFEIMAAYYNKGIPALEAPPELLDRICNDCQGVVLAVSD
jgi:hypothetical protein